MQCSYDRCSSHGASMCASSIFGAVSHSLQLGAALGECACNVAATFHTCERLLYIHTVNWSNEFWNVGERRNGRVVVIFVILAFTCILCSCTNARPKEFRLFFRRFPSIWIHTIRVSSHGRNEFEWLAYAFYMCGGHCVWLRSGQAIVCLVTHIFKCKFSSLFLFCFNLSELQLWNGMWNWAHKIEIWLHLV